MMPFILINTKILLLQFFYQIVKLKKINQVIVYEGQNYKMIQKKYPLKNQKK